MHARPDSLQHALELLRTGSWAIVAGGTDFYPGLRDQAPRHPILDISSLPELDRITVEDGGDRPCIRIGALATWSALVASNLPAAFDALKAAAVEVGSVQIQNRATIVGNLCNASPAADGVPPLLCLQAEVELTSHRGVRLIPLADFIRGNRKIVHDADELVTAIVIPQSACAGVSAFSKLGARRYLVISISMVAVNIELDNRRCIERASIAVGSCSEVARRLTALERLIIGCSADALAAACLRQIDTTVAVSDMPSVPGTAAVSNPEAEGADLDANEVSDRIFSIVQSGLHPIDDIRASGTYRTRATTELIRRTLASALSKGN